MTTINQLVLEVTATVTTRGVDCYLFSKKGKVQGRNIMTIFLWYDGIIYSVYFLIQRKK